MNNLKKKSILVTGGTGTFGSEFVKILLKKFKPKRLVVFSRDEQKQYLMSQIYSPDKYNCLRYFIGDVRDKNRVNRAFANIDIVVHAAAMKHVPASEYNPTECIATNIQGAQNIIDAAISNNVEKVMALSTDKASNPINLYGASKLCSDKLFIAANNLSGRPNTRFSIVRYGNVLGSRGSVIPLFKELLAKGEKRLPLTDENMTRFFIKLSDGVEFVINAIFDMNGGEIFIPKIKSIKIKDLIAAIAGKDKYYLTGIRPGEKLHEVMIPEEESRLCVDMKRYYIIRPSFKWWDSKNLEKKLSEGKPVSKNFSYISSQSELLMNTKEIKKIIGDLG
ncbi:MAG: UDP-N-acetylglucosamine 4,6-dehydratase (inverting) [Rickettsiales bacterium]|nr:UDP-N-acetylglucosamine 4,6-dehydratase (inverting) [Rickettsiales bacterium]MBJ57386.1 UDP-N-acetylglucosamine 4,6-dehydratase (inverting) [Rickettsiales bacterium]